MTKLITVTSALREGEPPQSAEPFRWVGWALSALALSGGIIWVFVQFFKH